MKIENFGKVGLVVTPTATEEIHRLLDLQNPKPLGIRINVYQEAGGVAQQMSFANEIMDFEEVFEVGGVSFIAAQNSFVFLENMRLNFVMHEAMSGFVFESTCQSGSRSCFNCHGSCCGRSVE